jgi:outer membrane receptor protein involved in Fe transport
MESPSNLRKLSPSVAVAYKPFGGDFLLRVFYKDYYRQPTFSETYFYHMGTQVLKPERVRQLGAGMTWQGRLPITETAVRLSVDGYYNDLTNKISAIPYNLFVWRMENRGKVVIHGLDVTFHAAQRLSARQRLLFSANYSLQNAVDRTDAADATYGKQSAYLPRHSGAASMTWENPWLSCGITFSGASERWATNNHAPTTNMPGYGELGATLYRNFSLRSGVLKASVSAHNLLNKTYEVVRRYPMPTRNFMATLNYYF